MENKQVVRNLYDAFQRGDVDAILTNLTEDFAFDMPGPAPFAGRRQGHEGMRQFFEELKRAVELEQADMDEMVAEGDKVVALGRERTAVRETGQRYESDVAHVFTLRGGQVFHWKVFEDTAAAAAVFGQTTRERQALGGPLGVTYPPFSGGDTPE